MELRSRTKNLGIALTSSPAMLRGKDATMLLAAPLGRRVQKFEAETAKRTASIYF
jgi:hypothetical protein